MPSCSFSERKPASSPVIAATVLEKRRTFLIMRPAERAAWPGRRLEEESDMRASVGLKDGADSARVDSSRLLQGTQQYRRKKYQNSHAGLEDGKNASIEVLA